MKQNKIYHLGTCSTCKRILKELEAEKHFVLQDIKTERITAEQLDEMAALSGSHEALFSRTAMLYKSMGLKEKTLLEDDYRQLILAEYTFLKRPVILLDGKIFIGNKKETIEGVKEVLSRF